MRQLSMSLAGCAVLLGVIHASLAAADLSIWSLGALWFAGSGIAIAVGGLLNLIMLRIERPDRFQKAIWLVANILLTGFFVLALPLLHAPQTVVGLAVFALLSLIALGGMLSKT